MEARKNIINDSPHNWVNNNRHLLLPYKGMWVAHNAQKVIAAHTDLNEMLRLAREITPDFIIYSAHHEGEVRFLPIRFRSVQVHKWQPMYFVTMKLRNKQIQEQMLIDSGADFCLIPYKVGKTLGLALSAGEPILKADGIGGSVQYVIKMIGVEIDGITHEAPVAWVQNKDCHDLIVGREVIFDAFDIEFKQAEEMIVFKKRPSNDVQ